MKKIKNLFATPKKAAVSVICIIAGIAILGTVSAFAASSIAQSSAIGEDNARNFAFADAGIDPVSAEITKTEFDFEQGQFVYEIEFTADGTEYVYWIKASDGTVVKKQMEIISPDGSDKTLTAAITLDDAKAAALKDAGLSESYVTFTKTKLDADDGMSVYEIEFYTEDAEYEYEINADSGAVYSKSRETLVKYIPEDSSEESAVQSLESAASSEGQSGQSSGSSASSEGSSGQSSSSSQISSDTAKAKALADAGVSESEVTYTKVKQDYDDGVLVYDIEFYTSALKYEYEINAATGAVQSRESEPVKASAESTESADGSSAYIGVDKAKSIALGHAGLSSSEVNFSKAKLEKDDGHTVYEIEFYNSGTEYEYTVNASTGEIMDFDIDRD